MVHRLAARAVIAAIALTCTTNTSAQFTTVINSPPERVPDSIGSNTQLNVAEGVNVYKDFSAGAHSTPGTNIEVNMSGGVFRERYDAYDGSVLNMSGGELQRLLQGRSGSIFNVSGGKVRDASLNSGSELNVTNGHFELLTARSGSVASISGGKFRSNFAAHEGSDVSFKGGEFLINGELLTGDVISLNETDVLTGTFENGSPFVFTPLRSDDLNGVKLIHTPLPPIVTEPINVSSAVTLAGLRSGQTLSLNQGGILSDDLSFIRSTLNVHGGAIGRAKFSESTVNIFGGDVDGLDVLPGSVVTISGGTVSRGIVARSNTTIDITGGNISGPFRAGFPAHNGENIQVVNISGGDFEFLGAYDGTQLDISGGTFVTLSAIGNSTVNITGGRFRNSCSFGCGNTFTASSGSVTSISGGVFGAPFVARAGSDVSISGGRFGRGLDAEPGSNLKLVGGEFLLNGQQLENTSVSISGNDVLTGTLQDGTSFIFSPQSSSFGDDLSGVTLMNAPLSVIETAPIIVNDESGLGSLRQGQTLSVISGGVLGDYFSAVGANVNFVGGRTGYSPKFADSLVNIAGGQLGDYGAAHRSARVNISNGTIGRGFTAFSGSTINVLGGTIEASFQASQGSLVNILAGSIANGESGQFGASLVASEGSVVNVFGGSVGNRFVASSGSEVNIAGGVIGNSFKAKPNSVVAISGGEFGSGFEIENNASVTISGGQYGTHFHGQRNGRISLIGGEFMLNGIPYSGSNITLRSGMDLITGTLEDGSTFIFAGESEDWFTDAKLVSTVLPELDPEPLVLMDSSELTGLRQGQIMTIVDGGVVGNNFSSVGAVLNVQSGTIGDGLEVAYSNINIAGGEIGDLVRVYDGSVVNISGGVIGEDFSANSGSKVTIVGGDFGAHFHANTGSIVSIAGGKHSGAFFADSGSEVHLLGTEFSLDGILLDSLIPGQSLSIFDRESILSGILADGSSFSFNLNSLDRYSGDYFDSAALLTVSLALSGDFDFDGDVDGSDLLALQRNPDVGDLADWQANFGVSALSASSTTVPEPTCLLFVLGAFVCSSCRRSRTLCRNGNLPCCSALCDRDLVCCRIPRN